MTKHIESSDIQTLKAAARRLREHLAAQGITLKQTQALEALSVSLGAANWRTLRAKLDAPAAPQWNPEEPRWTVYGIYRDNDQRYGDDFGGSTALEAQIIAQMDRLSDSGSMTEIEVTAVIDRMTGQPADVEDFTCETTLLPMSNAVAKVVEMAQQVLGAPPRGGLHECEEYDRKDRAVQFWQTLCRSKALEAEREALDELVLTYQPERGAPEFATVFIDERGVADDIDVREALELVASMAEDTVDLTRQHGAQHTGVFQVLQVRAFLEYFGDTLAPVFDGLEITATED